MPERKPLHLWNSTAGSDLAGPFDELRQLGSGDRLTDVVHQSDFSTNHTILAKQASVAPNNPAEVAVAPSSLVGRGSSGDITSLSGSLLPPVLGSGALTDGYVLTLSGGVGTWASVPSAITELDDIPGVSATPSTPTNDGEYLRYDSGVWSNSDLSISDDTSPQLSGPLDLNGNAVTDSGSITLTANSGGTADSLVVDTTLTHDGDYVLRATVAAPSPGGVYQERLVYFNDETGGVAASNITVQDSGDGYIELNADGAESILVDGVNVETLGANYTAHTTAGVSNSPHGGHATLTGGNRGTASGALGTIPLDQIGSNAPTAGYFLRADGQWAAVPGASGGEANTGSNVGTGSAVGPFFQKNALDLEFRGNIFESNTADIFGVQVNGSDLEWTFDYSSLTQVTPASGDLVLIVDDTDGAFKAVDVDDLGGGGGSSTFAGLTDVDTTGQSSSPASYLRYTGAATPYVLSALDISEDTSPTLGGNLALGGFSITGGNITLSSTNGGGFLDLEAAAGQTIRLNANGSDTLQLSSSGGLTYGGRTVFSGTFGSGTDSAVINDNMIPTAQGITGVLDGDGEVTLRKGIFTVTGDNGSDDLELIAAATHNVVAGVGGATGDFVIRGAAPHLMADPDTATDTFTIENTSGDVNVVTGGNLTVNGTQVPAIDTPSVATTVNAIAMWGDTSGSSLDPANNPVVTITGPGNPTIATNGDLDINPTGTLSLKGAPVLTSNITGQAIGDILAVQSDGGSGTEWYNLAAGSEGYVLTISSGVPAWAEATGGTPVGTLDDLTDVDSTVGSAVSGDLLYNDGTNWKRLASGVANNGRFLQVSGGVPSWVATAGLADIAAIARTQGNLILADGANWQPLGVGSTGHVLQVAGGTATWGHFDALTADIDVAGFEITSSSNGDVAINPNGSGDFTVELNTSAEVVRFHSMGSNDPSISSEKALYLQAGYIDGSGTGGSTNRPIFLVPSTDLTANSEFLEVTGDDTDAGAADTLALIAQSNDAANVDINLVPKGSGTVQISGNDVLDVTVTTPSDDQYIRRSGGVWVNGALDLRHDTSPQVGGDLDLYDGTSTHSIVSSNNADINLSPGTGDVTIAAGNLILEGTTPHIWAPDGGTPGTDFIEVGSDDGNTDIRLVNDGNSGSGVAYVGGSTPTLAGYLTGQNLKLTTRQSTPVVEVDGNLLISRGGGGALITASSENLSISPVGSGADLILAPADGDVDVDVTGSNTITLDAVNGDVAFATSGTGNVTAQGFQVMTTSSGTSTAGLPTDGSHKFYHTTHEEYFFYDQLRGHWVSEAIIHYDWGKGGSQGLGYTNSTNGRGTTSGTYPGGIPVNQDLIIVGYEAQSGEEAATSGFELEVVRFPVNSTTGSDILTIPLSDNLHLTDMTVDVDLHGSTSGPYTILLEVTAQTAPAKHWVRLYTRKVLV